MTIAEAVVCAFGSNISRVATPTCTVEIIRRVVGRRKAHCDAVSQPICRALSETARRDICRKRSVLRADERDSSSSAPGGDGGGDSTLQE